MHVFWILTQLAGDLRYAFLISSVSSDLSVKWTVLLCALETFRNPRQRWRLCRDPGILQLPSLFPCKAVLSSTHFRCRRPSKRCQMTWQVHLHLGSTRKHLPAAAASETIFKRCCTCTACFSPCEGKLHDPQGSAGCCDPNQVCLNVFAMCARCKVRFCRFGIYGADGDLRRRDLKQ